MCVKVTKVGQSHPKLLLAQASIRPIYQAAEYEEKSQWMRKHPWSFDYTMLRSDQIRCKPKSQRWSMRTGSIPETLKWVFRVNDSLSEKYCNSAPKEFMTADSRFAFTFHENRPKGNGWNDALFLHKKFTKSGFSSPFCARLAEGVKRLQGSVPHGPTSPCKISFQSVSVCRSYCRKVISYDRSILPSVYNYGLSDIFWNVNVHLFSF